MEDTKKPWEAYFPGCVLLYYVDYNDSLDGHKDIIRDCIEKNSKYPISEEIYDWWDFPEGNYMREMKDAMERDGIEWDSDWNDEIIERLRDEDKSDPIEDLLRNTSDIHCYYDLGVEVDEPFGQSEDEVTEVLGEIFEALGLEAGSTMYSKILSVYHNACYGGHLRIYFPMPLEKLLSGKGFDEERNDFKYIRFKGKFRVAIIDTVGGSGDFEDDVELDVTYKFDRDLLGTEQSDHYGFEEIFGDSCGIRNCESPEMIEEAEEETEAVQLESENLKAERGKQRKYQEAYDKGGCTFGDTDMYRHRDLEYINSYPCGWKCPHCGMFWVD